MQANIKKKMYTYFPSWLTQNMMCYMYESARAAITKYYKLGGINNRFLLSHSSGVYVWNQGTGRVGFF